MWRAIMPILHVIILFAIWTLLNIFVLGVSWLYALIMFAVTLLVIIAVYKR